MFNKFYLATACLAALVLGLSSCTNTEALESELSDLEGRAEALEKTVSQVNDNAISAYTLITGGQIVMEVNAHDNKTVYSLELSDGSSIDIYITAEGEGITPIVGVDEDGRWIYSIDGGTTFTVVEGTEEDPVANSIPQFRVNSDYVWEISIDGGSTWSEVTDADGNKMAANPDFSSSFFTSADYDEESGELVLVLATGQTVNIPVYQDNTMTVEGYEENMYIAPGETITMGVTFSEDVADATIRVCPDGWRVQITEEGEFLVTASLSGTEGENTVEVWLLSDQQYIRRYTFSFLYADIDPSTCNAWQEFVLDGKNNVLLDFSYAGYDHGETAPPEVTVTENADGTCTASNGYTVYNIEAYGADGTDDLTDREAFINMLTAALGTPETNTAGDQMTFPHTNAARNIIFYFPEGNFILHTEADNDTEKNKSVSVLIRGSNIILKGAGRDKTTLTMQDPNLPSQGESVMYSSPDMIQFKHNTGVQTGKVLATVTGDAKKGDFSVTVGGTSGLSEGDWVCLYMKNTDPEVVAEELSPYTVGTSDQGAKWTIATEGVTVQDLHQVRSVSGNTVTFYEPIMHEVKAAYDWTIVGYQHYENVGVEDLTFEGNAKESFDHHASWEDDGAYKPISMTRLVNSWMRRVDFVSVSEACSVIESANVSVYDCEISGTRGHAAIRSQASSRVFIGAVKDLAEGFKMDDLGHDVVGSTVEWTGQYHAVGVSKQSIGAVLWRNLWGPDGCFESHATQPRATLIDCCKGGWKRWRQGGDAVQMPNHLADLTIWNFDNTTAYSGTWIWWDSTSYWWKFLPPIVVGFHGEAVTFDEDQTLRIESNGTLVQPESLYEAQLERRLGTVPGWLTALKAL